MRTGLAALFALICDALLWLRLTVRSTRTIQAENLFLRRQLALYIERGVKPRRIDPVTRVRLNLLSKLSEGVPRGTGLAWSCLPSSYE
jgi:hypothetical protein